MTRLPVSSIWEAAVERAEALHDMVVLAQARPSARRAARIKTLAIDLATLAYVASLLGKATRS